MEGNGYIKLHRKMLENPIVCKDNDYFRLWMQLLLSATHKECKALFAGKKITLKPGQLITGRRKMALLCGISESKAQRILKAFESEQQIKQRTSRQNRIITICNWGKYQISEQQMNNKRTTNEQQMNTKQEYRESKNETELAAKAAELGMTAEEYRQHIENLRR